MKITFLGATRMVTGSCYLLEIGSKKMLLDCGMFQGSKMITAFNEKDFVFAPNAIDTVVLTHAHIDHSGLIPKLIKQGYKGPVHCTKTTLELCTILLPDSAHIQESDAEFANRKGLRAGKSVVEPLYTVDDAYKALQHFHTHEFGEMLEVLPGVQVKFKVAGHILGSAIVEVFVNEDGKTTKLVFTGDIGQPNQPIIEDPEEISGADFIITESTYGNRVHKAYDKEAELSEIINDTVAKGGNVVIPAFAVGRTQVLLYYFQKLLQEGRIPQVPIIIDSPMASKATAITLTNPQEYDEEARALYEMHGNRLLAIPNLRFTATAQESRMINEMPGPKIIVSASGMADAGRILHHLKHNLWREECTILFVGYQANGTLGRRLLEGEKNVKLFGESIEVHARIESLHGVSGHADMNGLLKWVKAFDPPIQRVFVVHGEDTVTEEFAKTVEETFDYQAFAPFPCAEVDLLKNEILSEGVKIPVKAKKPAQKKADAAYDRLTLAGKRLMDIIYSNAGLSNKDKAKFEAQINNLADKWEL